MSKKLYEETYIQRIASAIREKNGSTEKYSIAEMPDAIRAIQTGGDVNIEALNITENGRYVAPVGTAYSPIDVDVPPPAAPISYGGMLGEDGKFVLPEGWDDIESIPIGENENVAYVLCGCHINDFPFIRIRVYGSGTIQWDFGHAVNGAFVPTTAKTTVASGGYIAQYLGDMEDDYIVLRITATGQINYLTPSAWSNTGDPAYPALQNAVLMRYANFRMGTSILFPSYYLVSDNVLYFARDRVNTGLSIAGAYSGCYRLQRWRHTGWNISGNGNYIGSIANFFNGCFALSDVDNLDFSGWVTDKCTNTSGFFYNCVSLRDPVNVANWDLSNVTTMASTFYGCRALPRIDGFETWNDAPKCTSFATVFYNDISLDQDIDLHNLHLDACTTYNSTFYFCTKIRKLDVRNLNFSKATTIGNFVSNCWSLHELNMDNITPPTSVCVTATGVFSTTLSLKKASIANWDLSNASTLSFRYYSGISELDVTGVIPSTISMTDSSSNMMFAYNYNIEELDASWVDMSKFTSTYMHSTGFRYLYFLRDFEPPKNICKAFSVNESQLLSHESLVKILNNLSTVSTSTKLTIGTYNLAKLSTEEKAIATNKGWTLA